MPKRFQVFFNQDDDFFSFVFGFRVRSVKNLGSINDWRHFFGVYLHPWGFINRNHFDTHKAISSYDQQHVDEKPLIDLNKDFVGGYFSGYEEFFPTIEKKNQRRQKFLSLQC